MLTEIFFQPEENDIHPLSINKDLCECQNMVGIKGEVVVGEDELGELVRRKWMVQSGEGAVC